MTLNDIETRMTSYEFEARMQLYAIEADERDKARA